MTKVEGAPRTPRLRTARLDLVPLVPADAGEMVDVLSDPALYTFIGGGPPGLRDLRRRYRRLAVGRSDDGTEAWHNWIVRLAVDGRAVGTLQATVSGERLSAEIAWVIGVLWQGAGYASEAAVALVGWLADTGITTIVAHVHPSHAASAAVARRARLAPTDEIEDGERVWRWTVDAGA